MYVLTLIRQQLEKMLRGKENEHVEHVFVSQSCSVVDPNTGFEFNLQLLASKTGYKTNANGKDFLVRRTQ